MSAEPLARILLVDDRHDNLLALEAVLKHPRYELVKSASGAEALKRLAEHECALILLDVQMPEMDGFETARHIKLHPAFREIPIIFITAINQDRLHVFQGYESGAVDYLLKPFDDDVLRAKVAVIVELFQKTAKLKRREGELAQLNTQLQREIRERKHIELALRMAHEELESRVRERTAALAASNQALQCEIAERRRAEAGLSASLREKEILLKEIHHRVKNNLQIISSLLNLQADYVTDAKALQCFEESQDRIRAMALVHEKLYGAEDLSRIDMGSYIRSLSDKLLRAFLLPGNVTVSIQAGPVFLGIETAIPCGLILNELMSNIAKHAFPHERSGQVQILLQRRSTDQLILIVEDNGVGIAPDIDLTSANSLGLRLVDALVSQLDGTMQLDRERGTKFTIQFVSVAPALPQSMKATTDAQPNDKVSNGHSPASAEALPLHRNGTEAGR